MTYTLDHGRAVEPAFLNLPTEVQKAFREVFQQLRADPHVIADEVNGTYHDYCVTVAVDGDKYDAGLHIFDDDKDVVIGTIGHTDDVTV